MRTLRLKKPPMTGPDVTALQKLLIQKGFKVKADGTYGQATADVVLKAKKTIPGYPWWLINRMAGRTFVKRLTAYKPAPKPKPSTRDKIRSWWMWAIKNTARIGYSEYRPMPAAALKNPRELDIDYDCSTAFTLGYKAAGAPDPNDMSYDGYGNTASLKARGKVIPQSEIQIGDGVLFKNPDHIACVLVVKPDPTLGSHGTDAGPLSIPLSQESTYHNGPVTFLRFLED